MGQGNLTLNGVGTQYQAGQKGGVTSVTLSTSQVPLAAHTHPIQEASGGTVNIQASTAPATSPAPTGTNVLAAAVGSYGGDMTDVAIYGPAGTPDTMRTIATGTVSMAGSTVGTNAPTSAQPFSPLNPYLAVYYVIATNGIYPTRP